jgi:hypothetical protein
MSCGGGPVSMHGNVWRLHAASSALALQSCAAGLFAVERASRRKKAPTAVRRLAPRANGPWVPGNPQSPGHLGAVLCPPASRGQHVPTAATAAAAAAATQPLTFGRPGHEACQRMVCGAVLHTQYSAAAGLSKTHFGGRAAGGESAGCSLPRATVAAPLFKPRAASCPHSHRPQCRPCCVEAYARRLGALMCYALAWAS